MPKYKIAETETFEKKINTLKYPILRENPYFGPNIKKLKGEYRELYRYKIGEYRLFYKVSEETVIIFIIDIENRKDAYK